MIDWKDFSKVDIRCGTIIEVKDFPKAKEPAYQLRVDFGNFGVKNSSAQITTNYDKKDLIGKQVLAVVNLPKKQIANFFSECLILGLSDKEGEIVLVSPETEIENGEKLH